MVSLGDYEENIGQEGWYNKNRREEGRGREVGVEMEVGDKEEVLKKGGEIGRLWRVGVDEDLTMEERKMR